MPQQGPWDTGLQPERTTLAWVRTSLTVMVVCLLLARLAGGSGVGAFVVALGGLVAAALLVTLQSRRHYRRDHRLRTAVEVDPAVAAVLAVTTLTVAIAAAALALVLAPAVRG